MRVGIARFLPPRITELPKKFNVEHPNPLAIRLIIPSIQIEIL
jgi:hypothetical protein